jgi:hypothetical protein
VAGSPWPRSRLPAGRSRDGDNAGRADRRLKLASTGPRAEAARARFRELLDAKGHVVDNARAAMAGLDAAFAEGALKRTPVMDAMLADLAVALEQDEGQKLGGKSAEAARFILRAVLRELDNA